MKSQFGICLYSSSSNNISYNNITNSFDSGIIIASRMTADGNIIFRNNICNNGYTGIWMSGTLKNKVIGNNFMRNRIHARFEDTFQTTWLNNYWDDWLLPIPKPILGSIEFEWSIFWWLIVYPLPWVNFDWFPSFEPHRW